MPELTPLFGNDHISLYRLGPPDAPVTILVASTADMRAICNDPLLVGIRYTDALRQGCARVLAGMAAADCFAATEADTVVLHILRGGLNFGLREALGQAFGWNRHASAFISAQRARSSGDPEDWVITESEYHKVYVPDTATILFGDVVATGTSLAYALRRVVAAVESQQAQLRRVVCVAIGSERAEAIIAELDAHCRERFDAYQGATLVFLEGRFPVATAATPLSVRETGTDLLRRDAVMAPEFVESQYRDPAGPLERCVIYDAGSRAFWLPEYYADLRDYWQKTLALADRGCSFAGLLAERAPQLQHDRFGDVDLAALCRRRLALIP